MVESEREVTYEADERRPLGWFDGAALLIGVFLVTIALRWLRLPEASRAARWLRAERENREAVALRQAEREGGRAARATLAASLSESGGTWIIPFEVPELPAVTARAIDDAAVVLARLQNEVARSESLDVEGTVTSTVQAGGRVIPLFEPARQSGTLIVLLDLGRHGDHPWLGGFLRVLDRWERRGVRLLRFSFREVPASVARFPAGAPLSLADLGRRHGGAPLILFSPQPITRDRVPGGAAWTRNLDGWPAKAWIDPDPSPDDAPTRSVGFPLDRDRLAGLGFVRFGLGERDLVALADHLTEPERGVVVPARKALPETTPKIEAALCAWATAAALVPDASWDLLEHLRRTLRNEVGQWLRERRHVALLTRWVNEREGAPNRPHGRYLTIGRGLASTLRAEQFAREREDPHGERLTSRVLAMLGSLLPAPSEDPDQALFNQRIELKRLEYALAGAPDETIETLCGLRGSAVDRMVEEVLRSALSDGYLTRDQANRIGRAFFPSERPPKARTGVRRSELLSGHSRLWRRAAVAVGSTVVIAIAAVGSPAGERLRGAFAHGLLTSSVADSRGSLPRTVALEERAERSATDNRPAMLPIPAGTFVMGSPKTETDRGDEDQHTVTITRDFLLARTEVTQGQYAAVMGTNPSANEACGSPCPVESVAWIDAVRYANALSATENLPPCYAIEGDEVSWPEGLACEGYRLPTEAEWEYAARAGSTDRYAGTDDPTEVCSFGNVADATAKTANPNWPVFDCDDGADGIAPVAGYAPNDFRLHDMTGNVREWVWDWFGRYPGDVTDPVGPRSGRNRVFRGGSFFDGPRSSRVAYRNHVGPSRRYGLLGFRVARSSP